MAKTKRRKRTRVPVMRHDAVVASSPGTLSAPPNAVETTVSVLAYGPKTLVERDIHTPSHVSDFADGHAVVWVNMVGLANVQFLEELGDRFGLHHLALEDVLNIPQRPKLDDYGDHQFIVVRMPIASDRLETEQLSIFLGKRFVLTIQERPGDCLEGIRKRIREGRPRIRGNGSDYLVYSILDAIVDSYFPLLEHLGVTMDELESQIHQNPEKRQVEHLHEIKSDLVSLRRYLWPLRELNATLLRQENPFLTESTRLFMRDCYDHSVNALDLVDSYRDIATGLMELYLSMMSQRMNEVMKVLTIIATIFIPLSFIAGLYGMNFDPGVSRWNMPELGWRYGYPAALGVMALCGGGMLVFFWRKGWFR